jgi:hypothetical protein
MMVMRTWNRGMQLRISGIFVGLGGCFPGKLKIAYCSGIFNRVRFYSKAIETKPGGFLSLPGFN